MVSRGRRRWRMRRTCHLDGNDGAGGEVTAVIGGSPGGDSTHGSSVAIVSFQAIRRRVEKKKKTNRYVVYWMAKVGNFLQLHARLHNQQLQSTPSATPWIWWSWELAPYFFGSGVPGAEAFG